MLFLSLSWLPLLCSLFVSFAATQDIAVGSRLTAANSSAQWTSPQGTFSLSYIPHPSHSSLFLLSLSFVSSSLTIWSPLPLHSPLSPSSSFQLLPNGNLVLLNDTSAILWQSSTGDVGVAAASLLENGNLILKDRNSSVRWQSFGHPTDTIVAGQNFTSKQSLASGDYSFSLLQSGNLSLYWNNTIQYLNKGYNSSFTANKTITAPVLTLQQNGMVSLSDTSFDTLVIIVYCSDYSEGGNIFRFLRLDQDGNLRAYSANPGSSGATEQWSAVEDQCEVFGYCGNMGVCTYNDSSPVCICPSGNFDFVEAGDPRKGCVNRVPLQDCQGSSTMQRLDHTQFLTFPAEVPNQQFFIGITSCQQTCLSGKACVASTVLADGSGICYLKASNFVSGYQSASLPSTSFVKICGPSVPNPPSTVEEEGRSKLHAWVVVVVVLATMAGLSAVEWAVWRCFFRKGARFRRPDSAQYDLLGYASGAPVQFSYRELERSTKNFSENLGVGGFGAVYRGVLSDKTAIAVKQLEGIEQGEKQFRMEVATISSTHHLNLVRLIGFCSEGRHRLLVYEFMKNGSLDAFLFGDRPAGTLPWAARFTVAIGTARGIMYLHEECRDCIVHCDIKPENILLDDSYRAKVSDFGLAKLMNPKNQRADRTLTSIRGTRGYLAPELLSNAPITAKSDVYSYGMVLLEIVSGRRNFDVSEDTERKKFSDWAFQEFVKGNIGKIVDGKLNQEADISQAERALRTSFWCIQEQPSLRPSMGKVVQMLEGVVDIEMPTPPRRTEAFGAGDSSRGSSSVSGSALVVQYTSSAKEKPSLSLPSPEQSLTGS